MDVEPHEKKRAKAADILSELRSCVNRIELGAAELSFHTQRRQLSLSLSLSLSHPTPLSNKPYGFCGS